jgi:hypothetical protein
MPKAINWSQEFLEEILNESPDDIKMAIRLGSLYFDNDYYKLGDVVDIRVNHKVERTAVIVGSLKLCKIEELTTGDIAAFKKNLDTQEKIAEFLKKTYNQNVKNDTMVTVIKYKNFPIRDMDDLEDPHMC